MPIKVFISYSHKDEDHKDALDEHLTMLKRNNIIDAWHDRKIIPGQDWANEISTHLEQSDLILFLMSPSFLASEYCFNVEAKRALEMHNAKKAQLIPIVVRPCDWSTSELSKLQAVPKDARPITTWNNYDEAWLNAINGIKCQIENFKPKLPKASCEIEQNITVSDETLRWCNDIEVMLTHRKVDKINLDNIYVSLDMAAEQKTQADDIQILSSDIIFSKPQRYLISGEEQQGKTGLLKNAYKQFLKMGTAPVYLEASVINRSDIQSALANALKEQYANLSLEQYLAMPGKALLVDNLNSIGLNTKYRGRFLASLNALFDHVIVTCSASFVYVAPEVIELDSYEKFELLGMGHIKRAELVEKWISLGIEESIEERDLYEQCDELKFRLDTIIRKNIVPAKPIYILMLLQMFEAYAQQNLDLSSHGHCYQQLIYQAFDLARIPKNEIDKYLNVLTELSWVLHKYDGAINQHQLDLFFKDYEKTYLPVDGLTIINKLKSNSILIERDFKIQFKYPYLYYFFAAKKIAESYTTNTEIQESLRVLIDNLHREDYANILVFVTHHTKEKWVLEEIQKALSSLFSDQKAATLSKDQLSFMDEFIAKIPDLVMEQREIRDERIKHNKKLDEIENAKELDDYESIDILANINKSFKGMEISGQIIRNRHATLTRDALFHLASQGALTGLRFLNFFIHISDTAKSEVIKFIEHKLQEHPNLTNIEVQDYAKDAFLHITYGVINGVIRKIASSIGSREATEIYKSLEKNEQTPAVTLLNQAIDLHFKRNLDTQAISQTAEKLKGNPICTRILKEMVIQHTYMFPVGYKEKQQLSAILGIPIQKQRLMDRQTIGKG